MASTKSKLPLQRLCRFRPSRISAVGLSHRMEQESPSTSSQVLLALPLPVETGCKAPLLQLQLCSKPDSAAHVSKPSDARPREELQLIASPEQNIPAPLRPAAVLSSPQPHSPNTTVMYYCSQYRHKVRRSLKNTKTCLRDLENFLANTRLSRTRE